MQQHRRTHSFKYQIFPRSSQFIVLIDLFSFRTDLCHVGPLYSWLGHKAWTQPTYRVDGVSDTNHVSGENSKFYSEEIQDFFNNEWGFKRRERDDVKKPGPRLDAKTLKILYHNKTVTG